MFQPQINISIKQKRHKSNVGIIFPPCYNSAFGIRHLVRILDVCIVPDLRAEAALMVQLPGIGGFHSARSTDSSAG